MPNPHECGRLCRQALADHLKERFGLGRLKDRRIVFEKHVVFAAYSDFHECNSLWFYGVPRAEWEESPNQMLAFLMKESSEVTYVLLDGAEATLLLARVRLGQGGETRINIRRPANGGQIYFVEWQEFQLNKRTANLPVTWPSV
jgi:hypothetical protein